VESHPQDPVILGNAAAYFLLFDRATAEDLLKKAQAIEPQNPRWSEQLGHLYALTAQSQPGTNSAAKALAEFEKAQTQTGAPAPEFYKLVDLAKMAFSAGDMEKARTYATELLRQAPSRKGDWNYGNAIQHGNIVLGRIALRDGKVDEAKKYLLEAGKTPGSPQLNSFGPNMSLAKDLLEKGETNAVLEYFQQCGKFWKMGGDKLDEWATLVKAGQTPDFGANLAY
jgi:tetratricopeptide (TPR) repeat protein